MTVSWRTGNAPFETHLFKVEFLKVDLLLGLPGDLVIDGQHRRPASDEVNLATKTANRFT